MPRKYVRKSKEQVRAEIVAEVTPIVRDILYNDRYYYMATKKLASASANEMFNENYSNKISKRRKIKKSQNNKFTGVSNGNYFISGKLVAKANYDRMIEWNKYYNKERYNELIKSKGSGIPPKIPKMPSGKFTGKYKEYYFLNGKLVTKEQYDNRISVLL